MKPRTAPKDYICNHCVRPIFEGTLYKRRNEHTKHGMRAGKYHIECEQAKVSQELAEKGRNQA